MVWKPDVTVAAVVEEDGRFLLVEERVSSALVFNQPAGHVEAGETLLQAVVREALEETAWHFTPEFFLGIYLWKRPERPRSFLRVAFGGKVTHHDPLRPLDRGIRRTVWFTREQIEERRTRLRSPMVLRCIDDYTAGRRYPLEALQHIDFTESSPKILAQPSPGIQS